MRRGRAEQLEPPEILRQTVPLMDLSPGVQRVLVEGMSISHW